MLRLRVATGCRLTGERVLGQILHQMGCEGRPEVEGVVNWGLSYSGPLPSLNARAGAWDKYHQSLALVNLGGPEVYVVGPGLRPIPPEAFPVLGRTRRHSGGTDIKIAFGPEDVANCVAAGSEFFSRLIRAQKEYRVWIYRRRHLGTYEKYLAYPRRFKGLGRNYDNGWAFGICTASQVPRQAVELAAKAVTAMELDFGAVDILYGVDSQYHPLEVNTAPGVEGPDRQAIQALARHIARWHELGFPERRRP